MYDVILKPLATETNDDGFTLNPTVIMIEKSTPLFYGIMHIDVTIGDDEYIPDPEDQDITRVTHENGDEDITIKLNVYGSEGGVKIRKGTVRAGIMHNETPAENTPAAVQNLIGTRKFNMTAQVYRNNNPVGSGTGTINSNSDIEIY